MLKNRSMGDRVFEFINGAILLILGLCCLLP